MEPLKFLKQSPGKRGAVRGMLSVKLTGAGALALYQETNPHSLLAALSANFHQARRD